MSNKLIKGAPVNLILGVTGGIAAYKSADLVRRLKENNFDVRVVMTNAAKHFITPMTMQAVSGNPVHDHLFDCQAEAAMGHIELAKWADVILIAPATANCLAKITFGFADDLLSTLILASSAQLIICPAMNQQMWSNEAVKANVESLQSRNIQLLGPAMGLQACGDNGYGRMLEPLQIVERVLGILKENSIKLSDSSSIAIFKEKNVMITAGPTIEAIDPVRYISNHSSGKMGYALAEIAVKAGAKVTLVSGPVNIKAANDVNLISVKSASEMLSAVKENVNNCDVFIGCAAVADYTPCYVSPQKIKKNDETMQIALKRNPDILSWVASRANRPFVVGFAAESQHVKKYALKKLVNKKLDMICANNISGSTVGFNSDYNEILLLDKNHNEILLPAAPKIDIALSILREISKHLS